MRMLFFLAQNFFWHLIFLKYNTHVWVERRNLFHLWTMYRSPHCFAGGNTRSRSQTVLWEGKAVGELLTALFPPPSDFSVSPLLLALSQNTHAQHFLALFAFETNPKSGDKLSPVFLPFFLLYHFWIIEESYAQTKRNPFPHIDSLLVFDLFFLCSSTHLEKKRTV